LDSGRPTPFSDNPVRKVLRL